MVEDVTSRLRKAVKENNLFLVKRLIAKTNLRNPDPASRRYTSLAWAAVLGHEETFEFLLNAGHDEEELSRDSEDNTILMLLADTKPPPSSPYEAMPPNGDVMAAALRMARLYYDRYSWVLAWSNLHGETALHIAALKGNEELARMLCDLGANYDLPDNKGNTPLHYASSWGHIPVVQLLIERGCQYAARNKEGFTASDYAYSFSTRDTLQDTARLQFENNKKTRRNVYAQAAARGHEWGAVPVSVPLPIQSKARDIRQAPPRMRSGSSTSHTTATSDSGEIEHNGAPNGHVGNSHSSISASSSPSQQSAVHSTSSSSFFHIHHSMHASSASNSTFSQSPAPTQSSLLAATGPTFSLSPIATRMRERDADAMEKYMRRNRSGSHTSSTDAKSQNGSNFSSAGPSANGDDIASLISPPLSGSTTPRRRLRTSLSAAQLSTTRELVATTLSPQTPDGRSRSGTNPTASRSPLTPLHLSRSSSTSESPRSGASSDHAVFEGQERITSPPSQYTQFPKSLRPTELDSSTPILGRRGPFHLLSKPLPSIESSAGHRRGASVTAVRGG